ncbi:MAG: DUF58 domain-containing protein [Sedimentisphaerales bacterium]|nr:DUF58 domain-containing protein [Sedimentisphaerales bacterium]
MLLTDPAFIRKLESLYLLARKVLGGTLQADRKSTKKGVGITFADYSEYSIGDDHRAIDWRVYARLETLMIRLFELEEDVTIYFLLDASHSMDSKFLYARQLVAALAYIALHSMDKIVIYGMTDRLSPITVPTLGRGKTLEVLRALEDTKTFEGTSDFNKAVKTLQQWHPRRGMVIPVSDFFFPNGYEEALKFLQWNKHEVFCIQTQNPDERRCILKGDVELECVETAQRRKITITGSIASAYEQAVRQWNTELETFCARHGIGLVSTSSDIPFDEVIQKILRRGGLVA